VYQTLKLIRENRKTNKKSFIGSAVTKWGTPKNILKNIDHAVLEHRRGGYFKFTALASYFH